MTNPRTQIQMSPQTLERVWNHLHPNHATSEEVAFLFAKPSEAEDGIRFRCIDQYLVPEQGFEIYSPYHVELSDETKARVIKQAHDLEASLIETHSHMGSALAKFSSSDFAGFREFVPHVWWRLKGRPYLALVASKSSFDGLAWVSGPDSPEHLDELIVGEARLTPTKLSSLDMDYGYGF